MYKIQQSFIRPEDQKQEELTIVHLKTMSKIHFSQTSSDHRGYSIQTESVCEMASFDFPPA